MRRIRSLVVVSLVALAAPAAALATPSQPVTLSVPTSFVDPASPFTSTGGTVCAAGTVETPFDLFVGGQSGTHAQILVGKHFVCPDGTFDLLLRVKLDFEFGSTQGTWSVVSGTGAYRSLHGTGTIVGTPFEDGIDDEYVGSLHLE